MIYFGECGRIYSMRIDASRFGQTLISRDDARAAFVVLRHETLKDLPAPEPIILDISAVSVPGQGWVHELQMLLTNAYGDRVVIEPGDNALAKFVLEFLKEMEQKRV